MTYNYADSQVVVGPLAQRAEPHIYDLCREHADRVTAPLGWEVLRLQPPTPGPARTPDPARTPGAGAASEPDPRVV